MVEVLALNKINNFYFNHMNPNSRLNPMSSCDPNLGKRSFISMSAHS